MDTLCLCVRIKYRYGYRYCCKNVVWKGALPCPNSFLLRGCVEHSSVTYVVLGFSVNLCMVVPFQLSSSSSLSTLFVLLLVHLHINVHLTPPPWAVKELVWYFHYFQYKWQLWKPPTWRDYLYYHSSSRYDPTSLV